MISLKKTAALLILLIVPNLTNSEINSTRDTKKKLKKIDTQFDKGLYEYLNESSCTTMKDSLDLCADEIKRHPDNFNLLWRGARSAGHYAECALGLKLENWEDICIEWGKKGEEYARKAQQIKPDNVEGYVWQTSCLGRYGTAVGVFTSISERILGKLEYCMHKAYEIDKTYFDYYTLVPLIVYYSNLPWPLKDLDKAFMYYKEFRSNAKNPWLIHTRMIDFAELLHSMDDETHNIEAKRLLDDAVKIPNLPEYYKEKAFELLEEIE